MPDELEKLQSLTVQRDDLESENNFLSFGFLNWVVRAGETIAPWWSTQRDRDLRAFSMGSDHLSGSLYALVARLTTIPFKIVPRDPTIDRHVKIADQLQLSMEEMTNFGKGWNMGYGAFILDYLNQDNGAFLEVIGPGNPDGPIVGLPYALNHLDSARCMRTRNPEYPVTYTDSKGKMYRLHYTRVIEIVSMPSADIEMNGVGFCGASRCINTAQHLIDISTYEQEKLGSRPPRAILVGSKVSTRDLALAFHSAERQMDDQNLSRFSKMIMVGNPATDIAINRIDLASIPDGFDKDSSVKLGMACIALALGVDLRELWPATITGATKADASLQHMKARGKAIGEILQVTKRKIEQKFLPPYLTLEYDYTDDDEDAAQASIMQTRSGSYQTLMNMNALTERTVRERLLKDGTITDIQFESMELESGRLPDGEPVLSLFYSGDKETRQMLGFGSLNPLEADRETRSLILPKVKRRIDAVSVIYMNTSSDRLKRKAAAALAALKALKGEYDDEGTEGRNRLHGNPDDSEADDNTGRDGEPDSSPSERDAQVRPPSE